MTVACTLVKPTNKAYAGSQIYTYVLDLEPWQGRCAFDILYVESTPFETSLPRDCTSLAYTLLHASTRRFEV